MSNAYVLMTAMPPTKGHRALIEFASHVADHVNVIVCTQPDEPFCYERNWSINQMCRETGDNVQLHLIHKTIPQEPEDAPGFWDMWASFLTMFGFRPGDTVVASESYGKRLAEVVGGVFMPFDIERSLSPYKATYARQEPLRKFKWIDHTFQLTLIKTITVFGAESTGKTTLSNELAKYYNGHWLFEYARPYLENTSTVITEQAMTNIWHGQRALQDYGKTLRDKPFVIQDTDLFSTVGYWNYSEWTALSESNGAPAGLIYDALARKSDLYIITPSDIPFEHDALRYGGNHREIEDQVWVDLCEQYGLNYVVLDPPRLHKAHELMEDVFYETVKPLMNYQRQGKEYAGI